MRKIIWALVAVIALSSCQGKKKDQAIAELNITKDSLNYVVQNRDSIINDALLSLSDISSTLNDIKRQEGIVVSNAELGKSDKDQIKEDLQGISDILKEKKATIARLQRSSAMLKEANIKIDGLQKLVDELSAQLEERDRTINSLLENIDNLKAEIERLNTDLGSVKETNARISEENTQKTIELNTAYYIVGETKALVESGVLIKKGRALVINPEVSKSKLTKVDIRNFERIDINGKKVEIIGGFPTSAYTLENGAERNTVKALTITDKSDFWRNSKVLVIAYK